MALHYRRWYRLAQIRRISTAVNSATRQVKNESRMKSYKCSWKTHRLLYSVNYRVTFFWHRQYQIKYQESSWKLNFKSQRTVHLFCEIFIWFEFGFVCYSYIYGNWHLDIINLTCVISDNVQFCHFFMLFGHLYRLEIRVTNFTINNNKILMEYSLATIINVMMERSNKVCFWMKFIIYNCLYDSKFLIFRCT